MSQRKSVVILLESESHCTALANLLKEAGFDVWIASNSDHLHQLTNDRRIDCLVLEQQLSGFLTGLEIVEHLRRELLNPLVVLIGEVDAELRPKLRELRIDCVLPDGTSLDTVCDCVQASLAVSGPAALRIPLQARQIADAADCFRPLPQLVVKVMSHLGEENGDVNELAHDISADARLTAELLRITNSSSYGLRYKTKRVFDAVHYLGYRRTASTIIAIAHKSLFESAHRPLPASFIPWFQQRTILLASAGFAFAERHQRGSAETAYVLGLFQDLGILAMAYSLGPKYAQFVERCRKIGQLQLVVGEQQQFGVDHAQVGAALLQKWTVPVPMIRHVLYHHDFAPGQMTDMEIRLTQIMRFAEGLADLHDAPGPQRQRRLTQYAAHFDGLQSESCKLCLSRAVAKTAEFKDLFQVPVPSERELKEFVTRASLDEFSLVTDVESEPETADTLDTSGSSEPLAQRSPDCTLLVIDDDPQISNLVSLLLRDESFRVETAMSAEAASGMLQDCQGILCDVHLRGMSGIEFVEAARKSGFKGGVVMMSGDRTRDTVTRSARTGAAGYLLKPFTKRDLLEALTRSHLAPLGSETDR